jgi:ribosomal protein S12 methylthiotransferase
MEVQQGIAHDHARKQVGRIVDCIVDGPSGERDDVWLARSTGDAPDIDCLVYLTAPGSGPEEPLTGAILPVEIVASSGYDLAGVPAEE